jgi:transcriptional regulator with PAS, ATPase and Fis domain
MLDVFRKINDAASVDVTLLVLGETGVGKELSGRAIHNNSRRRGKPYIAVNCAAIPEGLIESELYGHVKGAYTGAVQSRTGKFGEAHEGTLFLDEIGSMPKEQQPRLLRVLEDMLITPVGANRGVKVDTRVIASTNEDLYAAIRGGQFRKDLYWRLSAVTISVPPLRERIVDIPMLIKYFMDKYQAQYGKEVPHFEPHEYIEYMRYGWPGNVRELEGAVKDIVTTGIGKLDKLKELERIAALLNGGVITPQVLGTNSKKLREIERDIVIQALVRHNGNRTHTAEELGVHVRTVRNHVRRIQKEMNLRMESGIETEDQA